MIDARTDSPVPALWLRVEVSAYLDRGSPATLDETLTGLIQRRRLRTLELDLSGLDRIEEATLNVLRAAVTLALSRGQTVLLSQVPPSLTRAIYEAGLCHALHERDLLTRPSTGGEHLANVIPLRVIAGPPSPSPAQPGKVFG